MEPRGLSGEYPHMTCQIQKLVLQRERLNLQGNFRYHPVPRSVLLPVCAKSYVTGGSRCISKYLLNSTQRHTGKMGSLCVCEPELFFQFLNILEVS